MRRFSYGRINLGVAAFAMVATLPGRTQSLGLVTGLLIPDLQSRGGRTEGRACVL